MCAVADCYTNTNTGCFIALITISTTVRANVCPPCKSIGFSLDNETLVCDRCATTFDAVNGDGIGGACVDFPKAPVACEITDARIVMNVGDLVTAYEETIKPG